MQFCLRQVKKEMIFLKFSNDNGVMTRPIWKLINKMEMFKDCQCGDLSNSKYLEDRVCKYT